MQQQDIASTKLSTPDDHLLEFKNRFKGLEVQNLLSDSDSEDTHMERETFEKKKKPKFELEDELAGFYMELFFFFNDMHKLRLYLRRLWEDYRDGKVDVAFRSHLLKLCDLRIIIADHR